MKGIAKAMNGGNYTLSGKQKKMPGSTPAPKFRPIDRSKPKREKTKLTVKKTSRA